jgi:hypothetical protein
MKEKEIINILDPSNIGCWLVYKPQIENELGRLLRYDNEKQIAWVVYKANNNWDGEHWKDYTAESTKYEDLFFVGV